MPFGDDQFQEPFETKFRTNNPEAVVQKRIIEYLEQRGWLIMPTHGNAMQRGFPDLYCTHPQYGQRWVEVKYLESFSFTKAQIEFFPKITAAGIGIWILVDATNTEYCKLFDLKYPLGNWEEYHRHRNLLGSRALAHLVPSKEIKCVCGRRYSLRPSEKTLCRGCGRTVRGK